MTYPYEAEVSAARNRNLAYEAVIGVLERAAKKRGVTRKDIAKNLGVSPALISTWLSGPANWTLDTVSHLLFGAGATMDYMATLDDERAKSNYHNSASVPILDDDKSHKPTKTGSTVNNVTLERIA